MVQRQCPRRCHPPSPWRSDRILLFDYLGADHDCGNRFVTDDRWLLGRIDRQGVLMRARARLGCERRNRYVGGRGQSASVGTPTTCTYSSTNPIQTVIIRVDTRSSAATFAAEKAQSAAEGKGPTALPGVGDDEFAIARAAASPPTPWPSQGVHLGAGQQPGDFAPDPGLCHTTRVQGLIDRRAGAPRRTRHATGRR